MIWGQLAWEGGIRWLRQGSPQDPRREWWVARGSSVDVSHWRWSRPLAAGESGFGRGLGRGDRGVGLVRDHTDG